ncbi:Pre-mRNA-splicing factor SLU7 like protein, partial [Aduncisulcus paluster]
MRRSQEERITEEGRRAGIIRPATDENGNLINPHIPASLSRPTYYLDSGVPTLRHQRPASAQMEDIFEPTTITHDHYHFQVPDAISDSMGTGKRRTIKRDIKFMSTIEKKQKEKKILLQKRQALFSGGSDSTRDESKSPFDQYNSIIPSSYGSKLCSRYGYKDCIGSLDILDEIFDNESKSPFDQYNSIIPSSYGSKLCSRYGYKDCIGSLDILDEIFDSVMLSASSSSSASIASSHTLSFSILGADSALTRGTVSYRSREDTPKYLLDIEHNTAFYDPSTHSMRGGKYGDARRVEHEVEKEKARTKWVRDMQGHITTLGESSTGTIEDQSVKSSSSSISSILPTSIENAHPPSSLSSSVAALPTYMEVVMHEQAKQREIQAKRRSELVKKLYGSETTSTSSPGQSSRTEKTQIVKRDLGDSDNVSKESVITKQDGKKIIKRIVRVKKKRKHSKSSNELQIDKQKDSSETKKDDISTQSLPPRKSSESTSEQEKVEESMDHSTKGEKKEVEIDEPLQKEKEEEEDAYGDDEFKDKPLSYFIELAVNAVNEPTDLMTSTKASFSDAVVEFLGHSKKDVFNKHYTSRCKCSPVSFLKSMKTMHFKITRLALSSESHTVISSESHTWMSSVTSLSLSPSTCLLLSSHSNGMSYLWEIHPQSIQTHQPSASLSTSSSPLPPL